MEDMNLSWTDFMKVEMRVGTILSAEVFKKARKPAYKLEVDFGPLGMRKTSAQITENYTPEGLKGMQVIAVVNFPPKQIANMMSECLVLGSVSENGSVVLLKPEQTVNNGDRVA